MASSSPSSSQTDVYKRQVEVSAYVNTDAAAFTGNWTVGPGVELTMNGTDTKTAGSGWGTGSVTLQGATVLAGDVYKRQLLYRYNPDLALQGKNPLIVEGKGPKGDLRDCLLYTSVFGSGWSLNVRTGDTHGAGGKKS